MKKSHLMLSAGVFLASSLSVMADNSFAVVMSDSGSVNPFWGAVAAGAEEKGSELGIPVAILAPAGGETDVAGQIAIVEDQLAKGVNGIAIAPTDPSALVPVLETAIEQGVHVVFIDKSAEVDGVAYIGTDNVPAAAMGAQHICDNIEAGSDVAIIQGTVTNTTGQARARGSREALEECGLNIVAEQPADWDTGKALTVTENILTANPDIKGIFSSNDGMVLGVIEALRGADKLDDVFVVGFDGNPSAAEKIVEGELEATVAQRPFTMGTMGIEALLSLANGEEIEANVDTGAVLVTPDNAEEFR